MEAFVYVVIVILDDKDKEALWDQQASRPPSSHTYKTGRKASPAKFNIETTEVKDGWRGVR